MKVRKNSKMQIAAGNKGRIFWITLALLLALTGSVFAQDVNFEATVDQAKVSLGRGLRLNLIFYGTQDVPAPELPDIDGFDWRYLGPSKRISMSGFRRRTYILLTSSTLVFQSVARHLSQSLRTNPRFTLP